MTHSVTLNIVNKRGLHARAAAKFVKVVTGCEARVHVIKKGQGGEADSPEVDGASILGLMMLGADPGSQLLVRAEGAQGQAALKALLELVAARFGEPE